MAGPYDAAGALRRARPATVTSITDGDTLRVDTGAGNEPVRLLELDTPEVTGDCGASQATDALSRLAPVGSRLWLEADVEDRDRYGRLLRYLWRDDGTMVNEVLVSQGWARATLYPPNERYWPVMQQAEEKARERDAGLWKRCGWATAAYQKPDRNSAADPGSPRLNLMRSELQRLRSAPSTGRRLQPGRRPGHGARKGSPSPRRRR